jgi:hypothetical protein
MTLLLDVLLICFMKGAYCAVFEMFGSERGEGMMQDLHLSLH